MKLSRSLLVTVPLALAALSTSPAMAGGDCATYEFDQAHSELRLKSKNPFWAIENRGPSDVVLYVKEDGLVLKVLGKGDSSAFFGDANFTYILRLERGGSSARVQVCPPVK